MNKVRIKDRVFRKLLLDNFESVCFYLNETFYVKSFGFIGVVRNYRNNFMENYVGPGTKSKTVTKF